MSATPDIIPSDLTLEIGDSLSPEKFLATVRAFFGYVKEVEATLAAPGEDVTWTVHVREGSYLIGIEPAASVPAAVVQLVYSRVEDGIKHLAAGDIEGARLPEPALKHLRALSEMTDSTKSKPTPLRLWVKKIPVVMDPVIGRVITEDWRSDYSDFGAIEGKLETIQDHGTLEIRIRDVMYKAAIRCRFPETMLPAVFDSFRKRVEVSGIIHFRKNGTPISIDVEKLARLPDDAELPTAFDVKGLLRAG